MNRRRTRITTALGASSWLLLIACAGHVAAENTARGTAEGPLLVEAEPGEAPELPPSLADLAEDARRSVVILEAIGDPGDRVVSREGTGFVVSERGLVVTTSDLTRGRLQIRGHFPDGSDVPLLPVSQDPETKVALLEIPASYARPELVPVRIGDSESLRTGDWIMILGQSDGDVPTVTKGVFSGLERRSRDSDDLRSSYMRLDLPILSSYAGGPVFDMRGRLVGMLASVRQQPGFPSRFGGMPRFGNFVFAPGPITVALPSNWVRRSVEQLIARREPPRVVLGVVVDPASVRSSSEGSVPEEGARVAEVIPYSAAAAATVSVGDLLVEFDGTRIRSFADLTQSVARTRPGQAVTLVVLRNGERKQLRTAMTTERSWLTERDGSWGFTYAPLDPELRSRFSLADQAGGIAVTDLDPLGAAARAGLQLGDLVLEANRVRLESPAELDAALRSAEPLLLIERGGTTRFVVLTR